MAMSSGGLVRRKVQKSSGNTSSWSDCGGILVLARFPVICCVGIATLPTFLGPPS
jgi:hypothetical protein